jgi:hypothetical protein
MVLFVIIKKISGVYSKKGKAYGNAGDRKEGRG